MWGYCPCWSIGHPRTSWTCLTFLVPTRKPWLTYPTRPSASQRLPITFPSQSPCLPLCHCHLLHSQQQVWHLRNVSRMYSGSQLMAERATKIWLCLCWAGQWPWRPPWAAHHSYTLFPFNPAPQHCISMCPCVVVFSHWRSALSWH